MLTQKEIASLRRMVTSLGITAVAKKLRVHPSSINVVLAGATLRPNTIAAIRKAL